MSFSLTANVGRTQDFAGTVYEDDGTTAVTGSAVGTVLRFKAYRRNGATPILDLDSIGAASGGSILTFDRTTGAYTLKIAGGDTAGLPPLVYDAELSLVDTGDSDRIKSVEYGVLNLLEAPGGDIGLT
jgi:hypothetical protein